MQIVNRIPGQPFGSPRPGSVVAGDSSVPGTSVNVVFEDDPDTHYQVIVQSLIRNVDGTPDLLFGQVIGPTPKQEVIVEPPPATEPPPVPALQG